jgi:nucleotide sugar dehydrogenase
MQVAVIGTGYVGLVSGACLADLGHTVVCVDVDAGKIEALERGIIPIYEPGLEELVSRNDEAGRLRFTTDLSAAVADAELVLIAVGTPARRSDGHADLTYVRSAVRAIASAVARPTIVVVKSTVPVGTGDDLEQIAAAINPQAGITFVSNPEFLREGSAIKDFMFPDRIIVGVEDEAARARMAELYAPLVSGGARIIFTSRRTAELTKYAANAFLALKISFINEIADLCEHVGGNVKDVAHGIGLDSRIGLQFLNAGPGFGGSCFPKDIQALVKTGHDYGSPLRLIETTITVNEQRKRAMARKILRACGNSVWGKRIAVLGLTFKPDTDDMREAPSITIVQTLVDNGAVVRGYDPVGMEQAKEVLPPIEYAGDPYEAVEGADAVVLVTEWNEFRTLDLDRIRQAMRGRAFIDLRNVFDQSVLEAAGFSYHGVGIAKRRAGPVIVEAAA